jgi:exodeoxyribonuclease-3
MPRTTRTPADGPGGAPAVSPNGAPSVISGRAPLRIATWNINSVRLRAPLLRGVVQVLEPDVLCLQETKCPDEHFPHEAAEALGYAHRVIRGMKGYNGVAVLSRRPITLMDDGRDWCGRGDCRHLGVMVDAPGGPVELHNFYVPAGGDIPDRAVNVKFAHKLDFLAEVTAWTTTRGPARRAVLVGDLNVAPMEHDVWSHRQMRDVVSHTTVEVEALGKWQAAGEWHDGLRHFVPEDQKLYTWWSYRAKDWRAADRGRRLDHVWVSQDLAGGLVRQAILKDARDWAQTSDHVPVMMEIAA